MPTVRLTPPREALLVFALVLVVYLVASISGALLVGAWNDDGVYVVLGKAIALGQGYRSLHLVGEPVQVKYPPGFPFILSLLWRLAPSPEALKHLVGIIHPVVIATAAGLLWWLGRARLQIGALLLAPALLLPLVLDASIQYFTIPLSEPWFLLGWTGFLLLSVELDRTEASARRLALVASLGLVASATMLIRTQAIVLVGVAIVSLFRSRWRPVERAALATTAIVPLLLWRLVHGAMIRRGPIADLPDEGSYLEWFRGAGVGESLRRIAGGVVTNAAKYLEQLGPYLTAVPWLGKLLVALWLGLLLAAAVRGLRRHSVLSLTALGVMGVVLLWPFAQDRLLLAALPFLGLAAAAGVGDVARVTGGRNWTVVVSLLVALVLVRQVTVHRESVAAFAERRPPAYFSPTYLLPLTSRYLASATRWVEANSRENDRLLIDYPAAVYLYTGRKAIPANPAESAVPHSVFEIPGRYLAHHILADSVSVVVVGIPNSPIIRDIQEVHLTCPSVLQWVGSETGNFPLRFRVTRDEACLRVVEGR